MPRSTLASVEEYELGEREATFRCSLDRASRETLAGQQGDRTETGRTVPVTVQFYDPRTFRFSFHANPEAETADRLIDLDEAAITEAVAFETTEREGVLELETSALEVTVGLDEWSFEVADGDRILFSEQREDRDAKGRRRVDPLGFTEEETTNWPYRVAETGTAFVLEQDESLFGLGEKFTDFDKRGQTIDAWVTQPNGSATELSYKNVPLVFSSRGYGLLVDTTSRVTFDLGDTSTLSGSIAVEDDALEFVFAYGPEFEEIHRRFTALTGRPARPPKWSFGVWMSKYGYRDREELAALTERLREEEIPCDVVHLDPYWMRQGNECDLEWDTEAFPEPEEMIEELHDEGFHLSLWEHPYLAVGTEAFEEAKAEGYLVTDPTGDPYVLDRLSISTHRAGIVDFTDPEATEWWKTKHRELVEMGVDVFKTDFGEYLPRDAVFANGRTGRAMRNAYPHLYQKAVHEAMTEAAGPEDALLFARAGWFGTQRFPVHWSGDPLCTFGSMAASLRGGLSLALSGYQYWSHDAGGFKGEPTPELYVRWAQFGLLSSHTRFHGTTPREPWEYGEEALRIVREFAELRYRLLPYLLSYAETASRTGLPMMRPLVLHRQDDPAVYDLGDQYLLGEELLVAPVFDPDGRASAYLPQGEWVHFFTDERYRGGRTVHFEDVPLDELPLFVRAGSVIPMRETASQTVPEGTPERVLLRTTLASEAATETTFDFYDEDADRVVPIELRADADGRVVEFSVPDVAAFAAEIRAVERAPEELRVDERPLDRVDDDPEAGEWAYDGDEGVVVAEFD